jgi:hypothetical protein
VSALKLKTKKGTLTVRARKQISRLLLAARDKMNNDGTHWTRLTEEEDVVVGYEDGVPIYEKAYCSIGGINAAAYDLDLPPELAALARFEFAKTLDPKIEKRTQEYVDDEYSAEQGYTPRDRERFYNEYLSEAVDDAIANWNDAHGRQWREVSNKFKYAARKVVA